MPLGVTFISGRTLTPIFMNSVKHLQLHTRGLRCPPYPMKRGAGALGSLGGCVCVCVASPGQVGMPQGKKEHGGLPQLPCSSHRPAARPEGSHAEVTNGLASPGLLGPGLQSPWTGLWSAERPESLSFLDTQVCLVEAETRGRRKVLRLNSKC